MFPDTGIRRVPMEIAETDSGLNTISLAGSPNLIVQQGEMVELDCDVLSFDHLRNLISQQATFRLWDGGFFADGTIVQFYD